MPATVLTQEQTKNLLREVLIELLEERRSEFYELIIEAIRGSISKCHSCKAEERVRK
jgi:hypothetical protein